MGRERGPEWRWRGRYTTHKAKGECVSVHLSAGRVCCVCDMSVRVCVSVVHICCVYVISECVACDGACGACCV